MLRPIILAPLVLSLLLPAAAPVRAGEQNRVRQGVASGAYKPLTALIADLQRQHPGRVADVESKRGAQGQLQYEITLITPEGRKHELRVDAATGKLLPGDGDDAATHAAASLAALAAHLELVEKQTRRRVTEAEYERTPAGQPVYQLRLEQAPVQMAQRMQIDARTGALLAPAQPPAVGAAAGSIRPMHEMLRALGPQFDGHVLEVELKTPDIHPAHYELELRQLDGSALELKVHAHTLAVLQHRTDDD